MQLQLFNTNDNTNDPLPLVVAREWGFALQYHIVGDVYYYAAQDWLAGLMPDEGLDVANKAWRNMKQKGQSDFSKDSLKEMPYIATDRKTYQRDFLVDEGLYRISQGLRQK